MAAVEIDKIRLTISLPSNRLGPLMAVIGAFSEVLPEEEVIEVDIHASPGPRPARGRGPSRQYRATVDASSIEAIGRKTVDGVIMAYIIGDGRGVVTAKEISEKLHLKQTSVDSTLVRLRERRFVKAEDIGTAPIPNGKVLGNG